jgi:hypothetical protein
MTNTSSFQTATQAGFYDRSGMMPLFAVCADYLDNIAKLIPADPRAVIVPDTLRAAALNTDHLPFNEPLGHVFILAFKKLTEELKEGTYLDGNKNVCLKLDAGSKMLDAFEKFHAAQDDLRLNTEGKRHFEDRVRARQVYWDMGGDIAPTSYEPIYR